MKILSTFYFGWVKFDPIFHPTFWMVIITYFFEQKKYEILSTLDWLIRHQIFQLGRCSHKRDLGLKYSNFIGIWKQGR
jgi:hypothetical protein